MATILIVEDEKAIFNASLFVKKGIGYAIALDKIINTTGDSEPCFRPLSPTLEAGLCIVWKKYQVFSKASKEFSASVEKRVGERDIAFELQPGQDIRR